MNYFILFANCIPVKGAANSLIMDLQREEYTHIPTELFYILEKLKSYAISDTIGELNEEEQEKIMDYLKWLVKNNMAIFTSNKEDLQRFSPINTAWNPPFAITNLILYINESTFSYVNKIKEEINLLNIQHCELFIEDETYIEAVLEKLEFTTLKNLQINVIKSIHEYDRATYEYYCSKYFRISSITIFNSGVSIQSDTLVDGTVAVWLTPQKFQTTNCGVVSKKYFVSNIKSYTESLYYNSCLNRKITIDADGNIKNCPCLSHNYGHIGDSTLTEALSNTSLKKLWDIRKDQIEGCKDCEFRYVCTDCRAFVEDPQNVYSKPLKCGYDPYKGEWEEWSCNPLKKKAINYYGLNNG